MSNHGTFGENNPVWKAINRFVDMVILGIIFLITCIPIFTIGAALSAFYYTSMDSMRKEDGYIFKRFFTSFGKNFKQATVLWLIMIVLGAICGVNVYCWVVNSGMSIALVMMIISIVMCVAWGFTFIFLFPLQARFENTVGKTLQNAFSLAIANLPFTIGILVLLAILGYISYISPLVGFIMLIAGVGLVGSAIVQNFERLFKRLGYIEEDDGKVENDDFDFDIEVDYDALYGRRDEEVQEEEVQEEEASIE